MYYLTGLRLINRGGVHASGIFDVDSLNIRVQLLLGTLFVVTLAGNPNANPERDTFNASFPDLLI
jgi:hypothetical protein